MLKKRTNPENQHNVREKSGLGQRGMALLITIMVVSLLIAVTVQFCRDVRNSYFASATQLEGVRLRGIARSGFSIAAALLEVDGKKSDYDSLQELWGQLDSGELEGLFPEGELHLEVIDLAGRLPVNSLVAADGGADQTQVDIVREVLKRLLLSGIFAIESENQARAIVDALIDWLDSDEDESEFGAESGFYHSLPTPYDCRNGSVVDIADLLLVRGITPGLLYGENGRPGLADFLTVHGKDGRINVNTAPVELLRALHPLMSRELAEELDDFRRAEANKDLLADVSWYLQVPGFPGDIELPTAVLAVKSNRFLIRSEGRLREQKRSMTAVMERSGENRVVMVARRGE